MSRRRSTTRELPTTPHIEGAGLAAELAASDDLAGKAFAFALAARGVAEIDLGEEAPRLCDAVLRQTDRYFSRPGVSRVQDAWLTSSAVRRLAAHPAILSSLQLAYGRRPFPFQTLNFERGTQQPIHSDSMHFHSEPPRFMCGVWIALEDVAADAGPLRYAPGSHKLPTLTMRGAGLNAALPGPGDYERLYLPALHAQLAAARLPIEEATLRKGQALAWAANLAHGGAPVRDPQSTRRSLVIHYFFEDCVYYTPLESDEEGGRLAVRLPVDAATGLPRWPRRRGRPVRPLPGAVVGAVAKILLRRSIVS